MSFQRYPFHTASGLQFTYSLEKGRHGRYNKELVVDRWSESAVWSSVLLAFGNAVLLQGQIVVRPKLQENNWSTELIE